jgi:hypothetical protein
MSPPLELGERPEGPTFHYDPEDRHGLGEHIDVHPPGGQKERFSVQGPYGGSIFSSLPG